MASRSFPLFAFLYILLPLLAYARRSQGDLHFNAPRAFHKEIHRLDDSVQELAPTGHMFCHAEPAGSFKPDKKNIWLGLTKQEKSDVRKWLHKQKDLNFGNNGYSIRTVASVQPNKTEALKYLDGDGPEPLRFAQVTLHNSTRIIGWYQYIIVGPVPVKDGRTTWQYLSHPYTKESKGAIRDTFNGDAELFGTRLYQMGKAVEDITLDLWNATAAGYKNDSLYISGQDPYSQDDGLYGWFGFSGGHSTRFDTYTLRPLGLYFGYNITGDPSNWYPLGWLYDGIYFKTTEELRKAYHSGKLRKLPAVKQGDWSHTDRRGPRLPLDKHAPPTHVAPSGSRFFVDQENKVVKWMDFEFNIAFSEDTGLRLFDVKYKGNRILYELGLQEALAHYASNDPVQSGISYLDSFYAFGTDAVTLINGYDCPSYSTYMNISDTRDPGPYYLHNACLFEMDAGYPLARHTAYSYTEVTKNIYLTLRTINTVGNYDYLTSYEFYGDGTMRVDMRASGYIESTYQAQNEEYGYQIRDGLSGSMHDHILNFKADFDIFGTKNSLETVEVVPHTQVYPWSHGKPRNTMKLKREILKSEDESKLFWGHNGAKQYKVVNLDKPNKYGEPPGYRIIPSSGAVHLTIKNSSNLGRAINWAYHDLFVTKAKDTEPRSADPLNGQDINDPLIDFDQFFDGENLEQEDLVVWFNLGMHHVPHTGDLPNTMFTTAHTGVTFMPTNYLDGDPSVQSASRVRVVYNRNGGKTPIKVVSFGQEAGYCRMNVTGDELPPGPS